VDETHTEPLATGTPPTTGLRISVDPDAEPHAVAATTAYIAEFDELLTHLAAHPEEQWVAYRGGQRIGFGIDHLALLDECLAKFPDEQFNVYYIDPTLKYPDETVV
jgi:hypothetical protein